MGVEVSGKGVKVGVGAGVSRQLGQGRRSRTGEQATGREEKGGAWVPPAGIISRICETSEVLNIVPEGETSEVYIITPPLPKSPPALGGPAYTSANRNR